jgi:TonB family protein
MQELPTLHQQPEFRPWQSWPIVLSSLVVHAGLLLGLWLIPPPPPLRLYRNDTSLVRPQVTPLFAPRKFELTQTAPNNGPISKEITAAGLDASAQPNVPVESRGGRMGRQMQLPTAGSARPKSQNVQLDAPPEVAAATGSGAGQQNIGQFTKLPDAPPPTEKPKIAFESVRAANAPINAGAAIPKLERPTISEMARTSGRTAGDSVTEVTSTASNAQQKIQQIQLLSDPKNADFTGWLRQALAAVDRNWKSVFPESARYGRQGKSTLQFSVRKDGRIAKVVIVSQSGTDALDRAAVAGLSASDPLPPLPDAYSGLEMRFQMTFSYNMK